MSRERVVNLMTLGKTMRLTTLLLLVLSGPVFAAQAPSFGDSIKYAKQEEPVHLTNLRGKVVITIFFQSWCPICNKWAPDLIKQLQEQYAGNPGYILLGLKTDGGTPEDAKAFLAGKGADLSTWIIGSDEGKSYYQQILKDTPLWGFAIITPEGELAETGIAGKYYEKGNEKEFVLPASKKNLDKAFASRMKTVLPADKTYAPELKEAITYAESGRFISAINSARKVGGAPAQAFENDVVAVLTKRVEVLSEQVGSVENAERFVAFMELRQVADNLKGLPPGTAAKKAISDVSRDKAIQRELKAEKAWLAMQKAATKLPPEKRETALQANYPAFVKAYDGTHFARMAQAQIK